MFGPFLNMNILFKRQTNIQKKSNQRHFQRVLYLVVILKNIQQNSNGLNALYTYVQSEKFAESRPRS